jgi:hypothetical protein
MTMSMSRILRIVLLTGIVGFLGLVDSEWRSMPGSYSFVSPAEAVVGRPLTPVSVAGVARRTARRCATGVYNC